MLDDFKISVIIPMYNNQDTITDALLSITKQTLIYNICEIIVVDDGSNDDSLKIVQDFKNLNPTYNIIIIHQENSGPSVARNVGMRLSMGNWIAFLDADDEWKPLKIERQITTIIEAHKNGVDIDFLGTDSNYGDLYILFHHVTKLHKATIKELCIKSFPTTPSVLMKKKIFDEIGGFNEKKHYCEDAEYFFKICNKYNFYHLPEQLVDIGHGKAAVGEKGLSSNVLKMNEGCIDNINELYKKSIISLPFYVMMRTFHFIKLIRRCIIIFINRIIVK